MNKIYVFLVFCIYLLTSCKQECSTPGNIDEIHLELVRMDSLLINTTSRSQLLSVLKQHPLYANKYERLNEYPDDSILVSRLFDFIHHPNLDTLIKDVNRVHGDLSQLKINLRELFASVKSIDKDFIVPKVYTNITGFGRDLFVSDSVIVISLDYYMAGKSGFKPQEIPSYIYQRYTPEHICAHIALAISQKYNRTNILDNSLISEMMYFGKSYAFVKQVLPCLPDRMITGYSEQETKDVQDHAQIIYQHFVQNKLFFETNRIMKRRYIEESPKTSVIGDKCPGRIGRWLGWQIIKRYQNENPEVHILDLLSKQNGKELFQQAKYKP